MESRLNCLARPAMSSSPRPVSARPDADVGGGLLTHRLSEATGRLLRLAVQVPLLRGMTWRSRSSESHQLPQPTTSASSLCPAGAWAKGQFVCTACGNRVTVHQVLPRCTACGERLWERAE